MNLGKKIIYSILILLFILTTYKYYYNYIGNIITNNCKSILWWSYENNWILIDFIQLYKVWEFRFCNWYYNLLERAKFTFPLYFLFLWITIVPFSIYKFKLNEKYNFLKGNRLYIIWLIILIIVVLFSYLTINTNPDPLFPNWFPL